ncbi:MAG: hypothetical protein HZA52_07480 [Planctomycetes bacterium]|nr:hypothetical protein [Planctomycetota bacterium]
MTNPHEGSAPHKQMIDEEEDLFCFDELSEPKVAVVNSAASAPATAQAQVFTNLNEEAMSAVLGPAPSTPGTGGAPSAGGATPTAATVGAGNASPAAPAANALSAENAAAAATSHAATQVAQAASRVKFDLKSSPLLVGALSLFAIANLALIGLTWKSMSTLQQSLGTRASGGSVATDEPHGPRTDPTSAAPTVEYARIPAQLDVRPEGEETLDAAHEAMDRGDFERARRLLYGLLAVADRWEPTRRDDLEARAAFTIADSFRLQAEALVASGAAEGSGTHGTPGAPETPGEHDGAAVHAAETKPEAHGGHE